MNYLRQFADAERAVVVVSAVSRGIVFIRNVVTILIQYHEILRSAPEGPVGAS